MSATTIGPAKPEWSLASAPLPLSYSALCYIVHLLLVAFPIDWSRVVVEAAFSGSFLRDLDDAFLAFSASSRCSKLSQVGLVPCPLLPLVPFAPFTGALDTEIGTNSAPSAGVKEESASEESVTTSPPMGCRSSTDVTIASSSDGVMTSIGHIWSRFRHLRLNHYASVRQSRDRLRSLPSPLLHGGQPVAQGACLPRRSTADPV